MQLVWSAGLARSFFYTPVRSLFFFFCIWFRWFIFNSTYSLDSRTFISYRSPSDLWMWLSAIPMGQAICMSMAIGFYQIPTQANIFYAGQGFWSIILVALLGGWLGLQEGKSSPNTSP